MFRKGQSTLEYALMIAVVIAVIVVMQRFLSGGVGGRLKSSVDDVGEQFNVGGFTKITTTSYSGDDVAIESFGHAVNINAPAGSDIIDRDDTTSINDGVSGYEVKNATGRDVKMNDRSTSTWADEGTIF